MLINVGWVVLLFAALHVFYPNLQPQSLCRRNYNATTVREKAVARRYFIHLAYSQHSVSGYSRSLGQKPLKRIFVLTIKDKKTKDLKSQVFCAFCRKNGLISFLVVTAAVVVTEWVKVTGRSIFLWFGFHDLHRSSVYRSLVQFCNGLFGRCVVGHFHKAKATGAVGLFVHNNFGRCHFTIRCKKFS